MKTLDTLVEDIEQVISEKLEEIKHATDTAEAFKSTFITRFGIDPEADTQQRRGLRFSNLGVPCERKLWYSIHLPDKHEDLSPSTLFKFFYGDLLELVILGLAKEAGHLVQGEQTELEVDGIKGHRDCVIDGITVDVKSASSMSFQKFRSGLSARDDSFGYLSQLRAYVYAGAEDPIVTEKNLGAFLVIDKQHGHICLDVHRFSDKELRQVPEEIAHKKKMLEGPLPDRTFSSVPDGKSGNQKLGVQCSYCGFKDECWPNLRTFLYSNGPRFLTRVVRTPDVPEQKN